MSTLESMVEHCEVCDNELEIGQIGKCDDCQEYATDPSKLEQLREAFEDSGTLADCNLDEVESIDAAFFRHAHNNMGVLLEAVDEAVKLIDKLATMQIHHSHYRALNIALEKLK